MDFLPGFANAPGKLGLDLGMHVFHIAVNVEIPFRCVFVKFPELRQDGCKVFRRQQAYLFQHCGMGNGAQYVVRGQKQVKLPVLSHGETVDQGIIVKALVPYFSHYNSSPSSSST